MESHRKAALEMNALATEMNGYDDAHVELIGRLIALSDEVADQPTSD